jgi:hypothetical protein
VRALRSAAAQSEADYDQGKGGASTVHDGGVAELGWKHLSRLLAKISGVGITFTFTFTHPVAGQKPP